MFEHVLVPTDFSENAKKTLRCLTRIPDMGRVTLLHVVDATHLSKRGWTHGPAIENAHLVLNEEKKWLESAGFSVNTRLEVITSGDIPVSFLRLPTRKRLPLSSWVRGEGASSKVCS